jgi:hypothetical protein
VGGGRFAVAHAEQLLATSHRAVKKLVCFRSKKERPCKFAVVYKERSAHRGHGGRPCPFWQNEPRNANNLNARAARFKFSRCSITPP